MGLLGFAEYLAVKYAGYADFEGEPDISFGENNPISPQRTRLLKDKLILAYDKITDDVTRLPEFQQLNQELGTEHYWEVFKLLITSLAAQVESLPLKECAELTDKIIEAINELRNALIKMGPQRMPRPKLLKMDAAMKRIQDYLWKEKKRIYNLHDLKDLPLGTWDFGPGKNPAKPELTKKPKKQNLMDRLLDETEDKVREKLGPYATEQEINAEVARIKEEEKARKIQESKDKYNNSLSGKEKFKLR